MAILLKEERPFAEAVSKLTYANPFLIERIEFEREALGEDFSESHANWNIHPDHITSRSNVQEIIERLDKLVNGVIQRIKEGKKPASKEKTLFEDMIIFLLFHRCVERFFEKSSSLEVRVGEGQRFDFYREFEEEAERLLVEPDEIPHLFACFFQVRRAFYHIFDNIIGVAAPAVRLRAMVWQSIFTHDMRRYRRSLYDRMGDFTTLITGPSGTGKELAARAIGLSRYIPFEPRKLAFTEDYAGSFLPLNLSALSPTLIESELFGHRRGSFTGAVSDRQGWLEVCPPLGTVFLDEIGELDLSIQVKLLRVLESRRFQRLGESKDRLFKGKIIAATNRDLAREMQEGRFREDLYYRLCSDMVELPGLEERIRDSKEELENLVLFIARRCVEEEAEALAGEVLDWIQKELGPDYPWPGNIRELEQCVNNILIRKEYRPASRAPSGESEDLSQAIQEGRLTADELMRHYCTLVYSRTGSYEETARRLKLDRRTVKAKVTN